MKTACWLVGAMLALGSSVSAGGGGDTTSAVVIVTEADFGRVIHVNVGDRINVALNENGSTGFSWHCRWTPRAQLQLLHDTFIPGDPSQPGQGGRRHFLFRAATAGRTDVVVQYGQWWPGGQREPARVILVRAS